MEKQDSNELFHNFNEVGQALEFIQARGPDELLKMIRLIRQPTKIVSIYSVGSNHIAWILTTAKIKKGK